MNEDTLETLWEIEYMDEDNPDPVWFRFLIQDMMQGYIPMVLSPALLRTILQQKKSFTIKNDRLHRRVRKGNHSFTVPYLPVSQRQAILAKYHITLGHLSASSLVPLLQVRHYWPSMVKDVKSFIELCQPCQLHDSGTVPRHPLHPHEPVGLPFLKWGLDFIQDLPETQSGNKHIITAIDYATKYVVTKAVPDRTAATVATFIFEEIACVFGVPAEIVSDRASAFLQETLQLYLEILDIHHLPTTPYRPRSNGAVERMHRSLNSILTKLCAGDRFKWDVYLPQACLALNARIHEATGYSPFYLTHGCHPRLPGEQLPDIPPNSYSLLDSADAATITARELAFLGQNRAAALQHLKAQAERMKKRYDSDIGVSTHEFQVGDSVKMKHHDKLKFQFKWTGPYVVVDKGPNDTYYLMKPNGQRIDNTVNHDHLAHYSTTDPEFYYAGADAGLERL
jgi:hypothetical protein